MQTFPVSCIHQIEITSRCNLRCRYCVHPTMPRAKQDMSWETYERALYWAQLFQWRGTQGELNLAGIGESTMHPRFIDMLAEARKVLGPRQELTVTTNGLLVTDEIAQRMREVTLPRPVRVFVSLHRPEKAGPAVNALRKHDLLAGVSSDPALAAVDWAGQVKWEVTAPAGRSCPWVREGWVMVMADGTVTRCCFDGSGVGAIGNVSEDVSAMRTSGYKLCLTCDQNPGVSLEGV